MRGVAELRVSGVAELRVSGVAELRVSGVAEPLAVVVRGARVESAHTGHLVVLGPDGAVRLAVGDPGVPIWPRSSLKPVQAVAMLRSGLALDGAGLALACASHSGTTEHLAVVRSVLTGAGLTEDDLQNTPDLPLDATAAFAWRADGGAPSSITQNCSGKHAGMLATCVAAGWDPRTYRDPAHPLQQAIRATVEELTGEPVADVTVDGCGAPLLSTTVLGLARAFGRIASAGADAGRTDPEARVGRAMAGHPWLVGGPGRDVSRFMAVVPGLVAKDGAEGVYAAGLADGWAVAFKVADGAARPRAAILAGALEFALWAGTSESGLAGGPVDGPVDGVVQAVREVGHTPVLGHGVPVGEVYAVLGRTDVDVGVGGQW